MLRRLNNYFAILNIDEAIEFVFEDIDALQSEIEEGNEKDVDVSDKINELTACQNAVRRLKKLKLKYS